jgi:NhaP-type Na+/H+ or K+/H+ antiporter
MNSILNILTYDTKMQDIQEYCSINYFCDKFVNYIKILMLILLMGLCSMWLWARLLIFQRYMLLPSSGFKLSLCLIKHHAIEMRVYINILLPVCLFQNGIKFSNYKLLCKYMAEVYVIPTIFFRKSI